jgi:GDP-L-fucose synthase
MRVVVAGSGGMVGAALVRNKPMNVELFAPSRQEIDWSSEAQVSSYFAEIKPTGMILAAAKVGGIGANSSNQLSFLLDNLRIQNNVMDLAQKSGIQKLLFLGSSCIYPQLAAQPIKEESLLTGALEPTNEGYALAKITGVRLAKAISEEKNLQYFSLMPTNLYGQNDNFDKFSSHVPAALMRKFHEAKTGNLSCVSVWGSGKPRREFMHVDDLAQACWYMFEQNVAGELINVGTGEDIEIGEFAKLMAKTVGFEGGIEYDSSKPDGTPQKLLDVSRIHSYGWRHQIELEEGLRQTYSWFVNALAKGEVRGY